MKKVITLFLALVMCCSLMACGQSDSDIVADYVDEHGSELIEGLESSFSGSSGLTCESSIKAKGCGFILDIDINELVDVDDETKELLQSTYDDMNGTFEDALKKMQKDLPELEYFTVNVCDRDGEVLAVVTAGND